MEIKNQETVKKIAVSFFFLLTSSLPTNNYKTSGKPRTPPRAGKE